MRPLLYVLYAREVPFYRALGDVPLHCNGLRRLRLEGTGDLVKNIAGRSLFRRFSHHVHPNGMGTWFALHAIFDKDLIHPEQVNLRTSHTYI